MEAIIDILKGISVNQFFYAMLVIEIYIAIRFVIGRRIDVYSIDLDGEPVAIGSVPMIAESFGYRVTIPGFFLDRARTNRFILAPGDFVIGRYYDTKIAIKIKGYSFLTDFDDEIEFSLSV